MSAHAWVEASGGWIDNTQGEPVVEYSGCGSHAATWRTEGDYRLALAAPELLAALERLADNAEGRNLRGQTQETALRQAIAEARDVIAESRGGK